MKVEDWTQDKEWKGNPSLGLLSYTKKFENPYTFRMVPVTVFGKEGDWHFCVDAGPNSDFSYSGFCVNCETEAEAMAYVDRYKLFK